MNVTLKPSILSTMRKNRHIPEAVLAEKLKISVDAYKQYEQNEHEVSVEEADKIAKVYKRNWTLFLLDEAPEKPNFGQDHRTTDNKSTGIGYLTYDAVEEANYLIDFIISTAEDRTNLIPKFDRSDEPDELANRFREAIRVPREVDGKIVGGATEVLKFWIKKFGEIGINVSLYKLGEDDNVRAFSIFREFKGIIVLNTDETENGKLFSLMHELAHILIRNTGVCDLRGDSIETFCNKFASHLLIPKDSFNELVEKHGVTQANAATTAPTLARALRVSKLAVLTRMAEEKIISPTYYDALSAEEYKIYHIRKQQKKLSQEKRKGKKLVINPYVIRRARVGNLFLGEILSAYRQSRITPFEASNYLGFKPQTIGKFDEWVGGSREG